MKLVRSVVWTVLTYDAEGLTLTKADEKRIESAELWKTAYTFRCMDWLNYFRTYHYLNRNNQLLYN